MARTSLDEILRYLKPFSRFEGIEIDQFPIPSLVHREFPTRYQLKKDLIQRCKTTQYSERSTTELSLDGRLQSLGLLDAVVSDPVIEEISYELEVFEIEQQERALKGKYLSPHKFPLQFHRSRLNKIFRHVKQLQDDEFKYKRPTANLKAAHELMIREARALFPMYPFGGAGYKPTTATRSWDSLILSIYDTVFAALKSADAGRGRKELAIQLTKVICSPSKFFHPDSTPTSESVRNKIERRSAKRSQHSWFKHS
jgi:hypothetical protein